MNTRSERKLPSTELPALGLGECSPAASTPLDAADMTLTTPLRSELLEIPLEIAFVYMPLWLSNVVICVPTLLIFLAYVFAYGAPMFSSGCYMCVHRDVICYYVFPMLSYGVPRCC